MSITPIQLIIGLGNPGADYENTRHNAGYAYIDALANQLNTGFSTEKKLFAQVAKTQHQGIPVWLAKPLTFMNESGKAVQALLSYFKISLNALLVAHDELDLPNACIRLKTGGGTAGHNGLKSIVRSLGQQHQFHRVRLGIGHPGHSKAVHQYVLSRAPVSEQQALINNINTILLPNTQALLAGDIEKLMKQIHSAENFLPPAQKQLKP